jgi:hypothetical protein
MYESYLNYCNKCYVMLNHYDLGDFGDYQGYMGSSLRIWSLRRLFLDLCSYNLDGSVTAGIGAIFNVNISFVYLNKSFVKKLNSNQKSVSGHILYAQIRTIRWLIKVLTWGFLIVFLFRCPYGVLLYGCHLLGGNVWIKIPLRPGKWELWELWLLAYLYVQSCIYEGT